MRLDDNPLLISLSIRKKMGMAFLLPALLLGFVIYQYHSALTQTFTDYSKLRNLDSIEDQLTQIQNHFLRATHGTEHFAISMNTASFTEISENLNRAIDGANTLNQIEDRSLVAPKVAKKLLNMLLSYQETLKETVQTWKLKGLDQDSGLRGQVKELAQHLEQMAEHYKTGDLLLTMLQIRRGEQDFAQWREAASFEHVQALIVKFKEQVSAHGLEKTLQQELLKTMDAYLEAFVPYAQAVLVGGDPASGTQIFVRLTRQLEELLQDHFIPNLEENIQSLRREEHKYILLCDKQCISVWRDKIRVMEGNIALSTVNETDKHVFLELLHNYQASFLALVRQTERLEEPNRHKQIEAHLHQFLEESVRHVVQKMEKSITDNQAVVGRRTVIGLVFGGCALLLLLVLALFISHRFIGHIRSMEKILEAFSEPLPARNHIGDEFKVLSTSMECMVARLKNTFFQLATQGETLSSASVDLMLLSRELNDDLRELSAAGVVCNRAIQTSEKIYDSTEQIRTMGKQMEEWVMALSGISGGMEISLGRY